MTIWPEVVRSWGSSAAERAMPFPCDALPAEPRWVLFRAVDVAAPTPILFRWLCQLRAAPYSYDLLDNRGRRSPRTLTPGLERLEVGQPAMTIFRVAGFEPGRSITFTHRGGLFGQVVVSYLALPAAGQRSRLVVKLLVDPARTVPGRLLAPLLEPGDLVMMRRQLHTLRDLAEAAHRETADTPT